MSKIKLFIFILFLFICLFKTSKSYSQDSFYIKYFQTEEFNFKNNDNLIFSSSNFSEYKDKILSYKKVFIICNSNDFKYKDLVECSFDNVQSLDKNYQVTYIQKSNEIFNVLKITDSYTTIFFIPEINFSKPSKIEILSSYLQAIKNSDLSSLTEYNKFSGIKKIIFGTFDTWVFELFYLCVIGILFVSLTNRLLKISDKTLKKITLLAWEFIKNNAVMFLLLFLVIGLFFMVAKDYLYNEQTHNVEKGLFLRTVNPFTLHNSFSADDSRPLYLFVLFHTVIFICILLLAPFLSRLIQDSISNIKNINLKPRSIALIFLINIFGLLFLTIFNFSDLLSYIVLTFILSLIFGLLIILKNIYLFETFNQLEKKIILFSILILLSFNIICRSNKCEFLTNKSYRYDSLVGVPAKITMTPYLKKTSDDVLISNFLIYSDSPLFIDNYLFSFNKFSKINNKHISEFDSKNSFFIVSDELKKISNFLFSNSAILNILKNDKPSSFFYVTKIPNTNKQDLKIEIEYYCSNAIYKNFFKINQEKVISLNPCNNKEINVNKVSIILDKNLFDLKENEIYEITELEYLKSLRITDYEGKDYYKVNFINLSKVNNYYVVFKDYNSSEIDNYFFNDSSRVGLDVASFTNKNEFINYLKINKKIKNDFLIWSPDKYIIIKNDFKKN